MSNLAILDDFTNHNQSIVSLDIFKAPGVHYTVFDGQRGKECREEPERGRMPQPPVVSNVKMQTNIVLSFALT